jgi:hypothetical protein
MSKLRFSMILLNVTGLISEPPNLIADSRLDRTPQHRRLPVH